MTAQMSDLILMSKEMYALHTSLALPKGDSRIVPQEPHTDPGKPHFFGSTACWRRYVATWEIREDQLYLTKIDGYTGLDSREPIFADWVSSTLLIPQGERLKYVHGGFGGYWESEIRIKVRSGRVLSSSTHDMRPQYEEMMRNSAARLSSGWWAKKLSGWRKLLNKFREK
jgi:hypothetical protein